MCGSLKVNPIQFKFEKEKVMLWQPMLEVQKPHDNNNVDCCR